MGGESCILTSQNNISNTPFDQKSSQPWVVGVLCLRSRGEEVYPEKIGIFLTEFSFFLLYCRPILGIHSLTRNIVWKWVFWACTHRGGVGGVGRV